MKRLLARAYYDEPYTVYVVLQDDKRIERTEKLIETVFTHYVMKYGHVFVPEEVNAVAMWYPPEPRNCWKASALKDFLFMHKWISIIGVQAMPSRTYVHGVMKKHHLKKPHYYLYMLGVDPAHQGRGIGSHLVQHVLHMCNERGLPGYLECATEENVLFYQKHGFRVMQELLPGKGAPKLWCMIYEPK